MRKLYTLLLLAAFSGTVHAQSATDVQSYSSTQSTTRTIPVTPKPDSVQQESADGKYPKVYKVNFWGDGAITAGGVALSLLLLPGERNKDAISTNEFQNLNRSLLNPVDRWALDIQTTNISTFETYSTGMQVIAAVLPVSLFFTDRTKDDWSNLLLMYLEVNSMAATIYTISPLGPLFQSRNRPIVYHDEIPQGERNSGNNRNSFYSGHVASAAAATFFFAKVWSDYHPEMGCDKYWLYGAALVPPLIMGYCRLKAYDHFPSDIVVGMGVGALCGIMIPELHRIGGKNLSLGVFSSPEQGTGLTMQWQPGVAENAHQEH